MLTVPVAYARRGVRVPTAMLAEVRVVLPHPLRAGAGARGRADSLVSALAGATFASVTHVEEQQHHVAVAVTVEPEHVDDVLCVLEQFPTSDGPRSNAAVGTGDGLRPDAIADSRAWEVLEATDPDHGIAVRRPFAVVVSPQDVAGYSWPDGVAAGPPVPTGVTRPPGLCTHVVHAAGANQVEVRLLRRAPHPGSPELAVIRVCSRRWGATPGSPLFAALRTSGLSYAPRVGIELAPFPRWQVSFSCSADGLPDALSALGRTVREGAASAPSGHAGWEAAVTEYAHGVALGQLQIGSTVHDLVDRALVDAAPTDDVAAWATIDPSFASATWARFLDPAEMDLVVVAQPAVCDALDAAAGFEAGVGSGGPAHASDGH